MGIWLLLNKQWDVAVAFLVAMVVVGPILFSSPGMAGIDGYYHISVASMVWSEGLTFPFPYLEFTLLDQAHYVDMHMLFHMLQSPFTAFFDLETAAKLAAVVYIATACALLVWLLKQYEVRYPLFWAMLLLVLSESFLYRMMMPRPPVFALIYTWLAFHFLMQRSNIALAIVALLFTWSYKVFPILLPIVMVGMFVFFVEKKVVNFRPLMAVTAGMVAGLVVTPYFPDNVSFLWNAMQMKIFSGSFQASVGNEWYPLKTLVLLKDAAIPLALYFFGLILTNRDEWRKDPARLFWFLVATMWLLMLLKSRRFIEFFPPAALLFFIFAARRWLQHQKVYPWSEVRSKQLLAMAASLLLLVGGYHTLGGGYERMQKRQPVEAYEGGAKWLAENTLAGSRVFHTDWDDFPRLFFHNRHNIYIVGLDPDYMRLKDSEGYELWRSISRGKVKAPEDVILKRFESEYVFTDNKHYRFIQRAEKSPRMRRVYSDRYVRVYKVLPSAKSDQT